MKKNEIKIGAILSYIIIGLNAIIGIFYTPFLTRMLGQSEFGLYSLVATTISYLTILDFGFGNAIVVYTSKFLAKNDKIGEQKLHGMFLLIYIVIGIIAGLIGLLLFFNVDNMFGSSMSSDEIDKARILMGVLTFNLVITFPFSIFSNVISAYEKFVFSKCLNIFRVVALPLCMTPLLLVGFDSVALVVVTTIINMIVFFTNMIFCLIKLNIKFKFKNFDYKLLKEIFGFSFFIFLGLFVDQANWAVDKFILGVICGTTVVAVYSVAAQFNTVYLSFSTAISNVLLPMTAKMEQKHASDKDFSDLFIKTGRLQLLIMGLIISGFLLFGKQFIVALFGTEYEESFYIAAILMVPVTVPLIQNVGLNILQAKNKYSFRAIVYFFIAILNVLLSIILSQHYGGIGAAIGTAVSFFLGNIIIMNIYYKVKIHIDIKRFWIEIFKLFLPVLCISLIFAFAIAWVPVDGVVLLLLGIPAYTICYCVVQYLFGINQYEKSLIKSLLKRS